MKKTNKIFILVISILLISVTAAVYANREIIIETITQIIEKPEENLVIDSAEISKNSEKIKQLINNNDIIKLMEEKGYYEDEIGKAMTKFIRTATNYDFTDTEISNVYELMKGNYDLRKIAEIFLFTLDTENPRDFIFIKEIYDTSELLKNDTDNWMETAYNYLTENRNGVIELGEISYYVTNGITIDEMRIANLMSRKGKKPIKQILDEKINGKEWPNITKDIYENISINSFKETKELVDIYNCITLSEITGIDINKIVENKQAAEEFSIEKNQAAEKIMAELSITDAVTESIFDTAKSKFPEIPEKEISELLEKGFTIREIEEADEKSKQNNIAIDEILR